MKILLATLLIFTCIHVNADIYKWTDTHGVVHYGDSPPDSKDKTASAVTTVELSPIQIKSDGQVINPQQAQQNPGKYIQTIFNRDTDMAARQQAAQALFTQWQQRAALLLSNIQTKIDTWRNTTSNNIASTNKNINTTNKVEIYTAVWCGACKKAKQWLKEKNISFTEYDVEHDANAALRMQKLGGGGGIPFAVINGSTIEGFSAYRYSSALR